jgi:hypothetical protein
MSENKHKKKLKLKQKKDTLVALCLKRNIATQIYNHSVHK